VHNILFIGGEHADRINYATEYAQNLLCLAPQHQAACHQCINCKRVASHTHPNLVWVSPSAPDNDESSLSDQNSYDGLGAIKIDQIRRIVIENNKANFEQGVGIFIITHMHKATVPAANALLKVIEENHRHKIFMALAPSRASVLPTIASRLMCRPIKPTPLNQLQSEQSSRDLIVKISNLAPKDRMFLCTQFSTEHDTLMVELDNLSYTCHTMLRDNTLFPRLALEILEALLRAKTELKKNLNCRLVAEQLLLCLWPKGQL
jgi:DNA polymerase III delta prime subunit